MSANPNNTVKRSEKRKRRSRFSTLPRCIRNRTWIDLINIAGILQKEAVMPVQSFQKENDHSPAALLEANARSLSMLTAISEQGATKCLKILPLRQNEDLWSCLTQSYIFPIFHESVLTSGYPSIRLGGGTISMDFVEALLPDKNEPQMVQNSIAVPRNKPKKLTSIASKLNNEARDLYLLLFFKQVSVITTICSFFPEDFGPECHNGRFRGLQGAAKSYIADKLSRYVSPDWSTERMQSLYADDCCRRHMVDGWYLVSEVMKVQLQELVFAAEKQKNAPNAVPSVTKDDLEQYSVDGFLDSLFDIFNQVWAKMSQELGYETADDIEEDILISAVESVSKGGPTMPQIRYNATKFIPMMRKHRASANTSWDAKSVLLRCRAKDTEALERYRSFLTSSTGKRAAVRKSPSISFADDNQVEYSTDEEVPGTPPPPGYECFPKESVKRPAQDAKEPLPRRARHANDGPRRSGPPVTSNAGDQGAKQHDAHKDDENEYINDGNISDIEEKDPNSPEDSYDDEDQDQKPAEEREFAKAFNNSIQQFYAEVLGWPVVPPDPLYRDATYRQGSDLLFGNKQWLRDFFQSYGKVVLRDVTTAFTTERYRDHWKVILAMEVRGALAENVSRRLPNVLKDPTQSWTKELRQEEFLDIYVNKVSHSRFLTNLSCTCGNLNLTRRIVDEMRGGSLCLGYAKTDKGFTELSIIACRRICYDKDDIIPGAREQSIRQIDLSIAVSRERFRDAKLGEGSVLRMLHLMHFSTFLRTFKALEECFLIPKELHTRFYGGWGALAELPFANMEAMEKTVDVKSSEYLQNVKFSTTDLDDSQYEAVVKVFSNLGSLSDNSASLSLIQGPPGTGKTQTLRTIIGGALHHSTAGHIGRTQVNHLKDILPEDDIVRGSTSFEGELGIPDGKGGSFQPQCVRIAREDYNYKDLSDFSINSKALPIDLHWLNRDEPHRKRASSAARKALGKECLVVLTTIATSGGIRLRELRVDFDIVIIDEAGQTLEPEVLMPIVASCKRPRKHRCHVVQIGDHRQLRRMSNASHMIKASDIPLHFNYSKQMKSKFERLFEKSRCTISMLLNQYRMHPDIAKVHSEIFYKSLVKSPLPAARFSTAYNKGLVNDESGFAPLTIIDTSKLEERYEYEAGPGRYANLAEIHIVSETLDQLKRLHNSPDELKDKVSIIAPYRYAMDEMNRILRCPSFALHDHRYRNTLVQTVDSMQGREKDIIIFSATRSNRGQVVGFLENFNRLNVALSRARNLLIIIGDMSTLQFADTQIFKRFYSHCINGSPGCQLIARVGTKHSRMSGHAELKKINKL